MKTLIHYEVDRGLKGIVKKLKHIELTLKAISSLYYTMLEI